MAPVLIRPFCLLSIVVVTTLGQEDPNFCLQAEDLLYNTEPHREEYSWVCCNNQHMAEHRGFQDRSDVDFWGQLEADPRATNGGEFTFYDPQCGIPLYIAPRGRSFEEWKEESHHHGWPSFRDEERVVENLLEVGHGEMTSTCGTHLGHNIPDGRNRDCINLICMAGVSSGISALSTSDGQEAHGANDEPVESQEPDASSDESVGSGGSGEMPESSGGSGGGSGEMPESSGGSEDDNVDSAEDGTGNEQINAESKSCQRSVQASFFLVICSLSLFSTHRLDN